MNNEQPAPKSPLPPTAQMISLEELQDAKPPRGHQAPAAVHQANPLHAVKVRLVVAVGETQLTVGELLDAREGQVFELDRSIEQDVDLLLEGRVVARGQLVAVEDCFAVRVTELPMPLKV